MTTRQELFESIVILIKVKQDLATMEVLTCNPSFVHEADTWGTLLHYSAAYNSPSVARHLIEMGCEVNSLGSNLRTPLMVAVLHQSSRVVRILLEAGASCEELNASGTDVFQMAFNPETWNVYVIQNLYRRLRNVLSMEKLVDKLLLAGITMYQATATQDLDLMRHLLNRGLDINSQDYYGTTALHVAARLNNIYLFEWLLDHGANVQIQINKRSESVLLSLATWHGNLHMIRMILDRIDPHYRMINGCPIYLAFVLGSLFPTRTALYDDITQILLSNGANIPEPDEDNPTIIDRAFEAGTTHRIGILVAHIAFLDMKSRDYITSQRLIQVNVPINFPKLPGIIMYYDYCIAILNYVEDKEMSLYDLLILNDHQMKIKARNPYFSDQVHQDYFSQEPVRVGFSYFYNTLITRIARATYRLDLERQILSNIPLASFEDEQDAQTCFVVLSLSMDFWSIRDLEQLLRILFQCRRM